MKKNARKAHSSFKKESITGGESRPPTPDNILIIVKDLLNPPELLKDHNINMIQIGKCPVTPNSKIIAERDDACKSISGKHTQTCPTIKKNSESVLSRCPGSKSGGGQSQTPNITRAIYSDKVRLAFIPEEWFLFFHSKTGVSGPYIFGIVLANYLASKEIFIMEHEYYTGLSWIVILYIVVKKLGPGIAAHLDKEVDDVTESYEKTRKDEMTAYESIIKNCKDAQWRAEGQKLLLDAKKENVAMQLEAIFRERSMQAYKMVKGRMDYHVKRYRSEARIQQKWMIEWILQEVRKSITPDFEKQALDKAIQDLGSLASRSN